MTTTTIEKVTVETDFKILKDTAKTYGINYVGKSREALVTLINEAIDAASTSTSEVENSENNQPENPETENQLETPSNDESPEGNQEPEDKGEEDTTPKTTTPAATGKAPKWYENGYGNVPGDKVIIKGKHVHQSTDRPKVILQGRVAKVLGPSKKENMIQAILIDPKTGNEQNCPITLAFGEYADFGTIDVPIPQRKTRKKVEQPVAEEVQQVENEVTEPTNETETEVTNDDQTPSVEESNVETETPETPSEPTDENKEDNNKEEVEAS